jgi:hypothetical protein
MAAPMNSLFPRPPGGVESGTAAKRNADALERASLNVHMFVSTCLETHLGRYWISRIALSDCASSVSIMRPHGYYKLASRKFAA